MCNADRHDAGCTCGFGPPYLNSGAAGAAREWAEDIIEEPLLARRGLEELGYPERSIEEFLAEYSRLLDTGLPEPTLVVRINQLLMRHRTVERRVVRERLRVPLFRFAAPRVVGGKVEYSEGMTTRRKRGWWARIFGIGTGGSQEITYHTEHCYTATNGECKLVFVPIPLRIAEVDVYEGATKIGEGLKAQVELSKAKKNSWTAGRGVKALKKGDCPGPNPGLPDEMFDYTLAADVGPPTRVRRSWGVNVDREVFLGLSKALGVEVRVRVGRERGMRVDLELPAGYDYTGARGSGQLWWTSP
ncbi:MAG: hypothetical protein WD960_09135 [Gemmatimonadota bacterium]